MSDQTPGPNDGIVRQGEGAVHDDFLAQSGRHKFEASAEWAKAVVVDQPANGLEPKSFADERYATAHDNPPGCKQGDGLCQCEGHGLSYAVQDGRRVTISGKGRLGDLGCVDLLGIG